MLQFDWDFCFKAVGTVGGVGSAAAAAFSYARNTRTKRAEFLVSLHKAFFVDSTYQPMKALLDCDQPAEELKLREAVLSETAEFTDFLNFFELVAYLQEVGTLDAEDVDALLGYYLDKLREKGPVWEYIRQSSKGFEKLKLLLAERHVE